MDFDARMSEESQRFITSITPFLPVMLNDSNLANQMLEAAAEESIKRTVFENVEEKELLIDSLYDDFKIPVTVYTPKTVKPTSSIVVFFHGGGFKMFSRKTHRNGVVFLADHSNTTWVSVGYRLTPANKYPVPLRDCISVAKWVVQNKTQEFNASSDAKVGVCGDSAGGNLAAAVALDLRDSIAFQILVYPWLDLTNETATLEFATRKFLATQDDMHTEANSYVNSEEEKKDPLASPLFNENFQGLAKCLLLNAELDPLIGGAYEYQKRLQAGGVSSEMYVVKGAVHGFFHACSEIRNAYLEGVAEIMKFLNRV